MRLSIQEASHKLGVTEHTIRRRLHKGDLRGEQVPRPQGFTWVVIVDDNDPHDQPTQIDSPQPEQEPDAPLEILMQSPADVDVQPVHIASPLPALSTVQLAELQALRARVAVLEERDHSKNDLIDLLHDRLKSQDWQFGEVLNQLNDMQSRMLPPAPVEIRESEEEQAGVGWMFWRKGRAKAHV